MKASKSERGIEVNGIRGYRGTDGVVRVSDGHEMQYRLEDAIELLHDLGMVITLVQVALARGEI